MSSRVVRFQGGTRPLAAFLAGVPAIVLAVALVTAVTGLTEDLSGVAATVASEGHFVLIALLTLLVLRFEAVRPAALGLSVRHVGAGVAAFAVVWATLNVLGVGIAVVAGNEWGLTVLAATAAEVGVGGLAVFVFAGFVEEFAVRGYLQTRLIARLGDARRDVVAGILAASAVFALLHVPGALVDGTSPSGLLFGVVLLTLSGVAFGLLYEATHNLVFVSLLHALGNTWVLLADGVSWSGLPFMAFLVAVGVVYAGVALAYRRLARGTDLTPVVRRREATA